MFQLHFCFYVEVFIFICNNYRTKLLNYFICGVRHHCVVYTRIVHLLTIKRVPSAKVRIYIRVLIFSLKGYLTTRVRLVRVIRPIKRSITPSISRQNRLRYMYIIIIIIINVVVRLQLLRNPIIYYFLSRVYNKQTRISQSIIIFITF